jgi:alkylmercury lyase
VPDYAIAAVTGLGIMEVQDVMRLWPGVYRNDSGRIIGFWGLTVERMGHAMRVGDLDLYAWCAWDTLFLPGILGRPATVRSSSAVTADPIRVEIGEATVLAEPSSTAMSFLDPGSGSIDTDRIISTFCHHILFFSSVEEGEEWVRSADTNAFVLTVEDAFELGRAFNRIRFGLD